MKPLLFLLILSTTSALAQVSVIPKPQQVTIGTGNFMYTAQTSLYIPKSTPRLTEIISFFKDLTGFKNLTKSTKPKANYITFSFDKSILNDEAYLLSTHPDRIEIKAKTEKGMFWALQTLRQLMPIAVETNLTKTYSIPIVSIVDEPLMAWRGSMLDCSRHFMPINVVKKYIDMLSFYKLNTFHWHLTDDQGWRIEIKKYPKLTQEAAWRTEADGSRHGGFYTQDQIKDIVKYASKLNITVIPEIEMPGHSVAALAAYPNLSCTGGPFKVPTSFGVFQDVYCTGNEQTFTFLQDVLTEVMALFPSKYIHIGGDECPKERWKACAKCQLRMKNEGLKDEHELQSYFIKRIQRFLTANGKNLTGWDEIMEGGLAKGATVQVWNDMALGKKAAQEGNYVISSPTSHCYFDGGQAGLTTEKVYSFNPVPEGISPTLRKYFLGGEANLWTEYIPDFKLEAMAFPRLAAFAEALWTKEKNFSEFHERLQTQYPRLDAMKVQYGPENKDIFKSTIKFNQEKRNWTLLTETGMSDMEVRYTIGKTAPDAHAVVKDSLIIKEPNTYQFEILRNNHPFSQPIALQIVDHLALAKPITLAKPQSPNYIATGNYALVDGLIGSMAFRDGVWQGWSGDDLDAVIDLGIPTTIRSVGINFFQANGSWIVLPKSISFLISQNKNIWEELKTFEQPSLKAESEDKIVPFSVTLDKPKQVRYVKIIAKNQPLPNWHPSKGQPAWIFADEVVVK